MASEIKYFMNKKQELKYKKGHHYLKKKKLQVTTVENGIILPAHICEDKLWASGGVIDERGKFIKESATSYLFGEKYNYNEDKVKTIDEEVVFFGPFVRHWGHFICDQINRLWYIMKNPTKYKIAYCGWEWNMNPCNLDSNFLELLELLGCKKTQFINIQQPTRFKKIIIPEQAFSGGNYYTKEFIQFRNKIVKNALSRKIDAPKKVYFSRKNFGQTKERGEDKIEKAFKNNGYKIILPEQLSVAEQITYFNKSQKIAMCSGSISHNLMFSRTSNLEAIIINKFNIPNDYQMMIDEITSANISYIDAYFRLFNVLFGLGPFLLIINRYFKQYFKQNNLVIKKITSPTIREIVWYFKKYHEIYSNPDNKKLLKSQNESVSLNS